MMANASAIQDMAAAVQRLATGQHHQQQWDMTTPGATGSKADSSSFSQYGLVTLMGWCCISRECNVPPIWARLLTTKDTGNQRTLIMAVMQQLSNDKWMDFDNRVYFSDKTVVAIIKLQTNSGESIPMFTSAGKGLSILACQPKTSLEVEEELEHAEAEWWTRLTRALTEQLQLEKGYMQTPLNDYEQLRKCISMFTL